jgi:serine/threonine protein phosphatase PrpC
MNERTMSDPSMTEASMIDPALPEPSLTLDVASVSDLGERSSNQDAVGRTRHAGLHLFAVADGTGGHHGGEVAARIVIDTVIDGFSDAPAFDATALRGWLSGASAAVAHGQRTAADQKDMSTTAAVLLVDVATDAHAARALWAHLGDTRIYLFRADRVQAISKDHSLTQQLVDAGYVPADQLRVHAQRNILLAAVGAEGEVAPDISDIHALHAGDALLVCSDGLWEWVQEAQMEAALAASSNSAAWLAALLAVAAPAAAAAGKARDNFSAYAIMVVAA